MSWFTLDNFELGLAGAADAAGHGLSDVLGAVGLDGAAAAVNDASTLAAHVYSAQSGTSLDSAEATEEGTDILGQAASDTADQIMGAVTGGAGKLFTGLEWGVGIAAGALLLLVGFKVWEVAK